MMAAETHEFDLAGLRLSAGEGRRLELDVPIEPLVLGSERYTAEPARVPVELSVSRMTGNGYALRLRFTAAVLGPCMRCLKEASPSVAVEAREVDRPGGGEELSSPYVKGDVPPTLVACPGRWPSPRKSSPTAALRSGAPSTRSARRR